jgi:hypothetical protein
VFNWSLDSCAIKSAALAGLHGLTGLCAAAVHGAPLGMGHSFTRLFAVTRSALWERIDLLALLKSYGTAPPRYINDNSTACKKVAIAIPPKPAQGLADSRLRAHCAQPVGRQWMEFMIPSPALVS